MIFPPKLRPGDTVAVVAPSGPFPVEAIGWRGLGFLAERYRLRFDRRALFARSGYLAGADDVRRRALASALTEPGIAAVLAARGGYGANRVAHGLDFGALRDHPRWIIGFSDVTVLHLEAARAGVASLHASNLTALGPCDRDARSRLLETLENPLQTRTFEDLVALSPGRAEGPLYGGNLAMLHACAAAGRLAVPDGAIVFFEDITEKPYRVDRMLTTLAVGGHFDRAAGFLVGEFTSCEPGPDGVTVEDVVRDRLCALGVPIAWNAPIGHGSRNHPVILGAPTRLEAGPTTARATFF